MKFRLGKRVLVKTLDGNKIDAPGIVVRMLKRSSDEAWVQLDARLADELHPFHADDARGRNVLAFDDECEAL